MVGKICANVLILLAAGCAVQSSYDRCDVSEGIEKRSGYSLGQVTKPGQVRPGPGSTELAEVWTGQFAIPEGVSPEDGLSQDEAVAIALWNNAQFQADLATLGFARADLVEAGLLTNPTFSLLFPVGPKLLEAGLDLPVDVLWQRRHRIAAARLDAESISENLVEHGLGLIRDVQTAYADLWSACERVRLAEEDTQLRAEMAELARKRLKAGDMSELATSAAHVDSLRAVDAAKSLSKEAAVLRQRLNAMLGLIWEDTRFDIIQPDITSKSPVSVDELLQTAFAARPDLRAAELNIEAAGRRVGWEKSKVYNLIAIIDAKDEGQDSLTVGPGFTIEVPIFSQNSGRIARARAELEQAARQYEAVRQNIILQVREAHTRYVSAYEEFDLWHSDIVPSLEKAGEQAQKAFADGQVSYLLVLESKQKLLEARMRQTESAANLQRSAAQLNYCVGKKMI